MSVATTHSQYQAYQYSWAALRDAYSGEAAVKGARALSQGARGGTPLPGTRYIPRPPGMVLDTQFAQYVARASWADFTAVVVNGMSGAIFRKEPTLDAPASLTTQLEDVTQTGVPLRTFAEQAVRETLLMGRFGILVDFPPPPPAEDAASLPSLLHREPLPPALLPAPRPYWVAYATEEILNWRTMQRQGDTILSLVVLKECVAVPQGPWPTPDFFVVQEQIQYRVLRLNELGQYEVSLWVEVPTTRARRPTLPHLLATWTPLRAGVPLDFIPFVFLAPHSLEPAVQKSLLEGLVEVNYRFLRHSADYEQALFLTANYTPYVCSDIEKPAEELLIGSSVAWWIQNANSKVGMLGLDPAGLPAHQIAMDTDKKDMASLGARLLESPADVTETRIAANSRTQGAESPMQSLITTVSQGLTQALQLHAWWALATDNVDDTTITFRLNKDIVATSMEPRMLTALLSALLNNKISGSTWWHNLKRGEIAPPMVEWEEEQALLEIEAQQQPLVVTPAPAFPPSRNGNARPAA